MEAINKTFDCIIVGGPQHGARVRETCSGGAALYPTLMTSDGQICAPVGFRRSADGCQLWLLMHPQATGAELREQVAASEDVQESWQARMFRRKPTRRRLLAPC